MVLRVTVLLIDDTDGSEADETIPFSIEGAHYEIDLNREHAQELRTKLAQYVKAARKATGPAGRPPRARKTAANDSNSKEIRAWARERGLGINDRGRIPGDIIAQYEAANGK